MTLLRINERMRSRLLQYARHAAKAVIVRAGFGLKT